MDRAPSRHLGRNRLAWRTRKEHARVMDGELVIRAAEGADATAMGAVHVRAWQCAYRGVMPDEYLDALSAEERAEMWRGLLSRPDGSPVAVAVLDGQVVGFATVGAERTEGEPSASGELYAMNLDPDVWGRGIGRALLHRATDELLRLGFPDAVLWVVPENQRARALSESDGWYADGAVTTEEILGVTVTDIRYRKQLL
jgi:GNAT superfamily N-acetyltransferase